MSSIDAEVRASPCNKMTHCFEISVSETSVEAYTAGNIRRGKRTNSSAFFTTPVFFLAVGNFSITGKWGLTRSNAGRIPAIICVIDDDVDSFSYQWFFASRDKVILLQHSVQWEPER